MTQSVLTQIAQAVTDELNQAEFSQPVQAVRGYLPRTDRDELASLRATVVPSARFWERVSRSGSQEDHVVDVGIQMAVDPDNVAQIDSLMALVQEVADHFNGKAVDDPYAVCVGIENDPVYSPDHMEKLHVFTSVLTLVFRTIR